MATGRPVDLLFSFSLSLWGFSPSFVFLFVGGVVALIVGRSVDVSLSSPVSFFFCLFSYG
jgi:hypothetical protein